VLRGAISSGVITSVVFDSDNNIIIGGGYNNASLTLYNKDGTTFNIFPSTTTNANFLAKYSADGIGLWTTTYDTPSVFDGNYKIDNHLIKDLILTIHNRGHHIGLHPSYTAGLDEKRMKIELARLRKVFYELKINEDSIGARMHYLRWFVNETWEMLDNMNLEHDATLGYADHIGFRASTCHPFKAYSLSKRKVFDMEVRPLIVMEASAIDPVYMNYGSNDEAHEQIIQLKKKCDDVFGIFSLLWHNSRLIKTEERALFSKLIKSIV
jgi:hypothetical protein